jgi:predicted amidophosphoribosyltransferase
MSEPRNVPRNDPRNAPAGIALNGDWDAGYAIHAYNQPDGARTLLGEAIYRYQYRKQWYLVDSLARWAQAFIMATPEVKNVDLLVPVPSSRVLSDYDPSSLLVDWISQLTNIPRAIGILNRYGLISEYSERGLDFARGGMTVLSPDAIKDKNVLVIDGIYCSGSTLQAASKALRKAGCKSITALVYTKIDRQSLDSYGFAQYDQGGE